MGAHAAIDKISKRDTRSTLMKKIERKLKQTKKTLFKYEIANDLVEINSNNENNNKKELKCTTKVRSRKKKSTDTTKKNPLNAETALNFIGSMEFEKIMEEKNNQEQNIIETKDYKDPFDGATLLMNAIYYENTPLIKFLINNGADLDIQANDGNTALTCAVILEQRETIKLLVENRANIMIKNDEGKTALDIARDTCQIEVVLLLQSALQKQNNKN
jgi:ankyrin repeat protein